jgi:2-polyprenyl-3-methyl-5-hydroxy-6-metoxy-1,4-benzoquinol methylase
MFEFHQDKKTYYNWQTAVTSDAVIPFLKPYVNLDKPLRILEVGCGEAGVLRAFLEKGHYGCGVELSESRAESASQNLKEYIEKGQASIISKNIYDIDPAKEWTKKFDVIVLKDVIEHIPNQEKFIPALHQFLNPSGVIFFAYPPWWMPFGGHQQLAKNKLLSKLPWYHLLPMPFYKKILKWGGESTGTIQVLEEIKETGIIIERLKKLITNSNYEILAQKYWLVNPIYAYKFKLKQRSVLSLFSSIPFIRNFYTTAHYILFKDKS